MYNDYEASWKATELMRRYHFVTSAPVCGVMLTAILVFISLNSIALAADDQFILQTDREFVQAAAKRDAATLAKMLDADFTWTDADGKTRTRAEVLDALPTPALGNETGAQLKLQTHSQVGAVMSSRDKTGVTNHDAAAWSPHIADEFVMLGSSNDHPLTKADRIATLNLQKQTGHGSAPAPLVSAHMFDFGDAVVMTCHHQPYVGKPVHVSRLWIKRNGQWVMSISYQTTVQAAPAKAG